MMITDSSISKISFLSHVYQNKNHRCILNALEDLRDCTFKSKFHVSEMLSELNNIEHHAFSITPLDRIYLTP